MMNIEHMHIPMTGRFIRMIQYRLLARHTCTRCKCSMNNSRYSVKSQNRKQAEGYGLMVCLIGRGCR